ncbi:PREDICTED: mucin-7-like [Myotis brandtii]|uniref:mucin-7-like n=1 Tax=Myotis brandtii TaxID=109478 RepID=UPI000703C3E7|nr:PREDICTED: mucin-7-like [Myotis brandtii]
MKTLPLLVCICALSACFKVSEGQRKEWNIYHRRNHNHRGYILDHQSPFHSQFRPDRAQFYHFLHHRRYYRPLPSQWEKYRGQKHYWPPKCLDKNKTVIENNTSEATTQVPLINLTSNSVKTTPSPDVEPTQIFVTTSARENTGTADLFAMTSTQQPPNTQTPQPSSASIENTVSPAAEQETLSPTQNAFLQFLQYIDNIVKKLSDLIKSS